MIDVGLIDLVTVPYGTLGLLSAVSASYAVELFRVVSRKLKLSGIVGPSRKCKTFPTNQFCVQNDNS